MQHDCCIATKSHPCKGRDMAKVNVNSATRDEFVEIAGLKPQVADAILKLRTEHGGKIAGLAEGRHSGMERRRCFHDPGRKSRAGSLAEPQLKVKERFKTQVLELYPVPRFPRQV